MCSSIRYPHPAAWTNVCGGPHTSKTVESVINQPYEYMPTRVNPKPEPTKPPKRMSKEQAGIFARVGAAALLKKHGPEHMAKIANARWDKHRKEQEKAALKRATKKKR